MFSALQESGCVPDYSNWWYITWYGRYCNILGREGWNHLPWKMIGETQHVIPWHFDIFLLNVITKWWHQTCISTQLHLAKWVLLQSEQGQQHSCSTFAQLQMALCELHIWWDCWVVDPSGLSLSQHQDQLIKEEPINHCVYYLYVA